MSDKKASRFPPDKAAYEKRERLNCFGRFFGESVMDAQGVVIPIPSANKCQDCPDTAICFNLMLLRQIQRLIGNQEEIIGKLKHIESRIP